MIVNRSDVEIRTLVKGGTTCIFLKQKKKLKKV